MAGQERKKYVGPLQIGAYTGNADYNYYLSSQDTIFEGLFQFQRSSLDALLEKEDVSFLFEGDFITGEPIGLWKFQFGKFQSNSQSKVVGYEYRVNVSGIQEAGIGAVNNGRLNGKWTYLVNEIRDSEIEKTLFQSTFTFSNGIPQQSFQIENDSITLVGRFLRNGLAHDEWSSFTADAIENNESWYFDEGLLKKVRIVSGDKVQEKFIFESSEDGYKTIRLDDNYLTLLRVTTETQGFRTGIERLLAENERYYQKMNSIISQLSSASLLPELRVRVPYFPLDTVQLTDLKAIKNNFYLANSLSKTLLNNSHLNIVRRTDKNAQYNYDIAKAISERYNGPLEKLMTLESQGVLEYVKLSDFIARLWPEGKPDTTISVVLEDGTSKAFALSNSQEYNFEGHNLKALSQLAEYARLSLEEIRETLSDQLTNEENLEMLNGLEEELIAKNDILIQQIDSVSGDLPNTYKKALENVKTIADASLRQYATIKNPEEKLAYGTELKNCFTTFISLSQILSNLPAKIEEIQLLYQDSIWNPFMATVMDEDVKKRITSAYSKILAPYFIEGVGTELSCENAEEWNNQILLTNRRMVELREEDTRKLERKLRKEKDPKKILELLQQQPKGKAE